MKQFRLAADTRPWRDPQSRPFVTIRNITKNFGDSPAVDDVSLDIHRSELFCLLGASGCGKSTLLRMLAGFEQPDSGTIAIEGQDMVDVPPHRRPTNMMFQSYALFPHMTVERNIAYGLQREGMARADTAERVGDILRLVKMDRFAGRKPHQLSGGQQQRVALARALVKRPKLLLLDEPLGALDKKLREETQFELIRIQETLGITFIIVTHDQDEAMTLSTRIGLMHEGRIVQVGEPREIYEFPASRYVADFIGSVNLFEGRVDAGAADFTRILTDDAGPLIVPPQPGLVRGQTVWVALRPERINLTRKRPEGENVHQVHVDEVGYMGARSTYRVRLGTGRLMQAAQSNRLREEDPITWDETVWASWPPLACRILTE